MAPRLVRAAPVQQDFLNGRIGRIVGDDDGAVLLPDLRRRVRQRVRAILTGRDFLGAGVGRTAAHHAGQCERPSDLWRARHVHVV